MSIIFFSNGTKLAAAGNKHISVRQMIDGRLLMQTEKRPGAEMACLEEEIILAFINGNDIQLQQLCDGMPLVKFQNAGHRLTISSHGTWLASTHNGNVYIWQIASASLVHTLMGDGNSVAFLFFSPDEQILVTGSLDGIVRLWQVSDGSLICTFDGEMGTYRCSVAFSPDEKLLTIATGEVRIRSVEDGKLFHTLPGLEQARCSVTFSPNGSLLALGMFGGDVKIWDTVTFEYLATLRGHTDMVTSLVFTLDGSLLFSGSLDGTIRIWGVPD